MKHYIFNGITYDQIPDPLKTDAGEVSPVSEALFKELGGEVTDDGESAPKQRVCSEFVDLIEDLAAQTDKITPAEFLAAAQNGISSDLVAFAREREVPEAVITEGRTRIIEIMADALRVGVTWAELIATVTPEA